MLQGEFSNNIQILISQWTDSLQTWSFAGRTTDIDSLMCVSIKFHAALMPHSHEWTAVDRCPDVEKTVFQTWVDVQAGVMAS